MLHRLLEREVRVVGGEHVVLGGFESGVRGCAGGGSVVAGQGAGGCGGLVRVVAAGGEVDGGVGGAIWGWR